MMKSRIVMAGLTIAAVGGAAFFLFLLRSRPDPDVNTSTPRINETNPSPVSATALPVSVTGSGGGGGGGGLHKSVDSSRRQVSMQNTVSYVHDLMNAGDNGGALGILEHILADGNCAVNEKDGLQLLRARLLVSVNRLNDAYIALDEVLATSTNPVVREQAAAKYYMVARDMGIISQAISSQQERLAQAPSNVVALATMAQLYQYVKRTEEEILIRRRIVEADATRESFLGLAEAERRAGSFHDAAQTMALLVENDPVANGQYLLKKADLEMEAGDHNAALTTATKALSDSKVKEAEALRFAAVVARCGQTNDAISAYRKIASETAVPDIRDRALLYSLQLRTHMGESKSLVRDDLVALTNSPVLYVSRSAVRLFKEIEKGGQQ